MKNVGEAAGARQKQAKKRSLRVVNEHFEPVFNAAMATQVVFQQPAKASNMVLARTEQAKRAVPWGLWPCLAHPGGEVLG